MEEDQWQVVVSHSPRRRVVSVDTGKAKAKFSWLTGFSYSIGQKLVVLFLVVVALIMFTSMFVPNVTAAFQTVVATAFSFGTGYQTENATAVVTSHCSGTGYQTGVNCAGISYWTGTDVLIDVSNFVNLSLSFLFFFYNFLFYYYKSSIYF